MKKLFAILGMITCMIGLCACGQEETAMTAEEQSMLDYGVKTVEAINTDVSQGIVDQYEALLAQYPRLTPEEFAGISSEEFAGMVSWSEALEDIGSFEQTNGGTVVIDNDEAVAYINVNVLGSDHNATVEIVLDLSTGSCTSITTNVIYSTGEIMVKAAMNTLIGMGTVFIVLILISLIISCFSIIPKIQAKKQQKAAAKTVSNDAQPTPVVTQVEEKEELSDDTELVAVIAAAIAAYKGSGSTDGFVVRSIRKSNKSKWQNA